MKTGILMSLTLILSLLMAPLSEAKNKISEAKVRTSEAKNKTGEAKEKISTNAKVAATPKKKVSTKSTANQGKALASQKLAKTPAAPKKALQKALSFNDRIVKGKHQVPGEGLVTVENDKPVFNLLSIRSDFNDRREEERQRD